MAALARPTDDVPARRPSTRERLLDEAFEATDTTAFSNLSLRELTRRVGIVPTGFYRHFPDMDALGLALVETAFGTLHDMIRSVREDPILPEDMIRGSVAVLADHVADRPAHFRFIARELNGGSPILRDAIRDQLARFTQELADDLGRLPYVSAWHDRDRLMLSDLIVKVVVAAAADMLEYPKDREFIIHRTEQQLRLAVLAIPHWQP